MWGEFPLPGSRPDPCLPPLPQPWSLLGTGTLTAQERAWENGIKGAGVESGTGFRPFGVLGNIRSLTWLISEEPPALTFYTQRRKMPPAPQSYMFPTKSGTGQGAAPPSSAGPFSCLLLPFFSLLLSFLCFPSSSPLPPLFSWAEISIIIHTPGSGLVKERTVGRRPGCEGLYWALFNPGWAVSQGMLARGDEGPTGQLIVSGRL